MPQKDICLMSPRSQSPASGRGTPINVLESQSEEKYQLKQKENKVNAIAKYQKERGDSKEHLYMVVIGHVDAGKSTLMGHLLCAMGQVRFIFIFVTFLSVNCF